MCDFARCTKCKSILPASDFNTCKRKKNGLTSWCKQCKAQGVNEFRASIRPERTWTLRGDRRLGSNRPSAKLVEHDIELIRKLLADGLTMKAVAEKFEVYPTTIRNIKTGKNWCHV